MKKLKVSVGELVQYVLTAGDLSFDFVGTTRSAEGMAAHRRVQASRPQGYQAEIPICRQVEIDNVLLEITGRIDGVFRTRNHIVIEEIKSTRQSLDHFKANANPLHWGQLKIYAYIYACQEEISTLEGRLTYFQAGTGEMRSFNRDFKLSELEEFFNDIVSRYMAGVKTIAAWERIRNQSIHKLSFPFGVHRPGQRAMIAVTEQAIEDSGRVIVQAATGIGKTMAVVFPSIKAIGTGLVARIFYLTARTTIRTVAEAALDELRAKGLKLRSLTLIAKEKICFKNRADCACEDCEFARGYYDRINAAMTKLLKQQTFTRDGLEKIAVEYRVCPFEFSLDIALFADFIICDYNYAFDPKVFLRRFFLNPGEDYIFLVDEAHNLVDRSREMFSAELQKRVLLATRRPLKKDLPDIFQSIGKINACFVAAGRKFAAEGALKVGPEAINELYPALEEFLRVADRWLTLNIKKPYREKLLELYHCVRDFKRVADRFDDTYAGYFEKKGKDLKLKLLCLDASQQLAKRLDRCRAAVFFSATMTPLSYFKSMFGCDDFSDILNIPSAFPADNLCLLLADNISTLYRLRQRTKQALTQMIAAFIQGKRGNYMIYFPSYAYMQMIHVELAAGYPGMEIILQTPGMPELEREMFLKRFFQDNPGTLVGLAVMGGIFGEGIDLVGERLSGAAIVGVGLPAICPERELLREYYTESHQCGYEFAYIYPGINRVLQAAGRVVRSENDRGAILLIDQRFAHRHYAALLPKEWQPIRVGAQKQINAALSAFWKQ